MSNLYHVSVPMFIKMLGNLKGLLVKGKVFALEQGFPESQLLDARLAPDMFPFTRQVQIASDAAKGVCAGLASVSNPVMEDTEASFDALIERCDRTIAFLETLKPEQFADAENKQLPFRYVEGKTMSGFDTLTQSSLPNFFFHVTTAYDILRHKGVPLGKADYIGNLPLQ